ncbi:hypothetical protein ACFY0A_28445 [Streptomyces sp. NPDC001698]|uniref:hypothetical protein n=1 Tax=unclassified Streptomyces TaxID=2593676 RepID=UPI0036AECEE1
MVRETAAHEDQAAHVHITDEQWHAVLIRWGVEVDNADAQRFYQRLGATLRPNWPAANEPGEIAGPRPARTQERSAGAHYPARSTRRPQ